MNVMKNFFIFIVCIIAVFMVSSCNGLMRKKEPPPPLDLNEVFPYIFPVNAPTEEPVVDPKEPQPKKTPKPVTLVNARILEYDKNSKVVYINKGSTTKGIKKGLEGKIYNDKALTQENGKIKLTIVYPGYSEGLASNQNYEIDPKSASAVFRIEN